MSEIKSYSDMRKDFNDKFTDTILPRAKSLEAKRKLRLFFAISGSIILVLSGFYFFYILKFKSDTIPDFLSASQYTSLGIVLFIFAYLYWLMIKKGFENNIKKRLMPIVFSCIEELRRVESTYSYNEKIFEYSHLIPEFVKSRYDDIFYGKYNGVNFEIIESEFVSNNGKRGLKVFDGVIIKLDMDNRFIGHTLICPKSLLHLSPSKNLKLLEFEDINFAEKFEVFTDDEADAKSLITSLFIERLNKIQTNFFADKIACSFYGNYLLVALHTNKNLFPSCSFLKSVDDNKQYFQFYEEILSIMKLIDYFKPDQKTDS